MSVFGNIPAFSGFGKPSIKLEFDDNEALLDFQKKMQAAGDDSELPEVDFDELKGTADIISKDDFYKIITHNPAPNRDNIAKENILKLFPFVLYDKNGKKYYVIKTPLKNDFNTVYLSAQRLRKHIKENFKHKDSHAWAYIKETLENPNFVYKYNDAYVFLKPFLKTDGTPFILYLSPVALNDNSEHERGEVLSMYKKESGANNKYENLYNQYIKGGGQTVYSKPLLAANTKAPLNLNGVKGEESPFVVDFHLFCDNINNNFADNQIFNKENLGAAGDVYLITDTRTRARKDLEDTAALKKYDIRKFSGEELKRMQTDDPLLYEQIKSDINTPATITPLMKQYNEIKNKYPGAVLLFNVGTYYETFGDDAKKIADVLGIRLTNKAGQYYAGFKVRDLDKNLKKLIKAGVKVAVCEQTEQALGAVNYYVKAYYPGLGKTANNEIYNNVAILDWRGFVPTYRILDDYSDFFKIADSKSTFAGFGLGDTKKLIADTCRQHWRDCMAIAKHLKGDSLLQSCFNLWHWLHYNIRYEYDHDGREEIRTPLRVWQDRARGVDCDCLSVFSWCVLKCMGYNPAFELVAFKGRPQFSHIFVNCDGVVVDRVWFIFNNRPPLITKSEIYRIDLTNDLAGLF